MNKVNGFLIGVVIILLLLLGIGAFVGYKYYTNTQQEISNLESTNSFLNGKLKVTENKLGQETASKEALEVTNEKYLLMMKDLEGAQKQLQDMVRELKPQVAAVLHTTTSLQASTETQVVLDTLSNDSVVKPVYKSLHEDDYMKLAIEARYDSTHFDLQIVDNIEISFERGGFLNKEIFVKAFNQNPYTKTSELEGYIKKIPRRNFAVGPSITAGFNQKLEPSVTLGISLTYSLIVF